jgi:lipoprotein-anchoring transpeptidase ErfK/SrfK
MQKSKKIILLPLFFFILFSGIVYYTTDKKFNRQVAAKVTDYSGEVDRANTSGVYHGLTYVSPLDVFKEPSRQVLGLANDVNKWIEVDLSEQKVYAWDGSNLFLSSLVSTGLPWWPTPTGEFDIWIKLRATRMEGGEGRYYYNLPNVPYVMFFYNEKVPKYRGFSLHGAYWHNDFGVVHSHGCVNLPIPVAEQLYYWANPVLPEGVNLVYASPENTGTRVVIHD